MAQEIKLSPGENKSSIPRTHIKMLGDVVHTCCAQSWCVSWRQVGPWGLLASQPRLIGS